MKYISVKVETTQIAADIVGLILIEEGSEGVSVFGGGGLKELQLIQKETYWDYADETAFDGTDNINNPASKVFVIGFFEEGKDLSVIKERLDDFRAAAEIPTGPLKVVTDLLDSADYENEWKKYYSVIEFDGVAVVPAWLAYGGSLPALMINPGKAFGTGLHETTAMCLSLLKKAKIECDTVLDVGCGSGILGLAALKMGAKNAVFTDIDSQATEATAENAALNGLDADIRLCNLAQDVTADVVLANLTADILLALQPKLNGLLKKGGRLIISGIIEGRERETEAAFSGFKLIEKLKRGPWFAYLYQF